MISHKAHESGQLFPIPLLTHISPRAGTGAISRNLKTRRQDLQAASSSRVAQPESRKGTWRLIRDPSFCYLGTHTQQHVSRVVQPEHGGLLLLRSPPGFLLPYLNTTAGPEASGGAQELGNEARFSTRPKKILPSPTVQKTGLESGATTTRQ